MTFCCICGEATDGAMVHRGECETRLDQIEADVADQWARDVADAADAYASLPAWRRWLVDWRQARSARRFRRRLRTSHHLTDRPEGH